MSDQLEMFQDVYTVGKSTSADDALWTTAGFGGPAISDFLGLSSPFRVTGRQALEQAAALICLDVLAQDISKATLRLKEDLRKGGSRDVDPNRHPVAEMLAVEPNARHTWVEYKQMLIYHLMMASNCYSYVQRDRFGDPTGVVPVVPGHIMDNVNQQTGEVFYDVSAATVQEAALLGFSFKTAPERDVVHVRNRMIDGFYGYSTLVAGGRTLTLHRRLEDYERKLYSEDGLVRGVFTRPKEAGELTDAGFRRIKSQLKKLMRNVQDGDPILLEDGITFTELAMKAHEAEMTKALDKQIEMICKLWRMPPHKAMHLTAVKYENLATLESVYVRDTLIPICRLIEERLGKVLLTRKERMTFRFEFDRDEMAIADEKVENERALKAAQAGLISHNEWREDQGYNPRKGGDVYTVPVNTVIVDENGEVVVSGAKSQGENGEEKPAGAQEESQSNTDKGLRLVASH